VRFRSIRVFARTDAAFSRETEAGTQHITAHFTSHPQNIASGHNFDFDQLLSDLNLAVHDFNARGSNFVLDAVTSFRLVITQYRPLAGSTFVPTPPRIANKKAVVNVQNRDNRCFLWAILSCMYPAETNPHRVSNYVQYENTLNFDGINFPVQTKDIPKFEKQNPTISVNVIPLDPENDGYCVEYMSSEPNREHHVNMLLLDDPESQTSHYVWIKSFSRLVADRTKHGKSNYVCNSCLNVFSEQRVLDEHIPHCMQHAPQQVVYPILITPTNTNSDSTTTIRSMR